MLRCLALAAFVLASTNVTDEQVIRKKIAAFIEAYNRADVDAVMAIYTDDLVKLRHRAAPETKPETAARLRQFFATYSGTLTVHSDELIVSGDLAFARGTLHIAATPRGGGEVLNIDRRFVELWRKDRGEWKVARTMDAEP